MLKAALIASAVIAAGAPAFAGTPVNPLAKEAVVLDLRKLDLASVEGQRVLAIRMDQAARDVCGDRLSTIHLSLEAQSRTCRADVVAEIRSRIESRTADARLSKQDPIRLAMR